MIAGIFHEGSGLGDQLFRYITVRTVAQDKGYDWGMINPENFKGEGWMDTWLEEAPVHPRTFIEKDVRDGNVDVRSYDPEINFVEDNTILDGSFEDDKYWRHNLDNISEWLATEPLDVPDTTCVVGFRGGEYASQPDLFLGQDYYQASTDKIVSEHYQVHTDDPHLAKQMFPDWEVVENEPVSHSKHTNMGFNWRSARYAKHAIVPNSAFFILPRILKHHEDSDAVTVAPRYWARRNTKVWARPACYYKEFMYV